ncbi:hypothetical protein KR009_002877 [Drosophila setifemur]|nr:hypothetical protein KR009_002877 [Drosophila setifemur]
MHQKFCRGCGKRTSIDRSLNIFKKQHKIILEQIRLLTDVLLKNCAVLPSLLCVTCQTRVNQAISFRERFLEVQRQLLESLDESVRLQIPEGYRKIFEPKAELGDECLNIQSIEEEKFTMTRSDFEVLEEVALSEGVLSDAELANLESNQEDDTFDVDYLISESEADDLEETTNRKESPQPEPQSPYKKRRNAAESTNHFVCDECGSNVKGRVAFALHCNRHRGIKEFECEYCDHRFCSNSELKRHTRKHTGEKPFRCKYCSRCFSDYSTRTKHERAHTNDRPYACKECGHAFTSSYILKNHMLVHTREKAFKCELCDKYFGRKIHLVAHYRSKAHKRKAERSCELFDAENTK